MCEARLRMFSLDHPSRPFRVQNPSGFPSSRSLKEALEVLEQEESDPENDEMIEIINSTVGKLQQIEDKYYYSLDLNYYLNNLEDDAYEA